MILFTLFYYSHPLLFSSPSLHYCLYQLFTPPSPIIIFRVINIFPLMYLNFAFLSSLSPLYHLPSLPSDLISSPFCSLLLRGFNTLLRGFLFPSPLHVISMPTLLFITCLFILQSLPLPSLPPRPLNQLPLTIFFIPSSSSLTLVSQSSVFPSYIIFASWLLICIILYSFSIFGSRCISASLLHYSHCLFTCLFFTSLCTCIYVSSFYFLLSSLILSI